MLFYKMTGSKMRYQFYSIFIILMLCGKHLQCNNMINRQNCKNFSLLNKAPPDILHMCSRVCIQTNEINSHHVKEFQEDFNTFTFFNNSSERSSFEIFRSHRQVLLFFSELGALQNEGARSKL